ncbi:hypothetical protein K439DRAFT_1625203 [Ramaria rubella]|nr:hypothetical protein K439DRAFT_1625203 [Ramaria rubella]
MAVDAYDMAAKEEAAEIGHDEKPKDTPSAPVGHWKLGSPDKHTTVKQIEDNNKGNVVFRGFSRNLMVFLHESFPNEQLTEAPVKILPHKRIGNSSKIFFGAILPSKVALDMTVL